VLVEDGVGEPLRMENFRDETDRELFGIFLLDGITSDVNEMAEMLSLGRIFRVNVE
jgi:hypothetical protein